MYFKYNLFNSEVILKYLQSQLMLDSALLFHSAKVKRSKVELAHLHLVTQNGN